jgi:hypothetical protein
MLQKWKWLKRTVLAGVLLGCFFVTFMQSLMIKSEPLKDILTGLLGFAVFSAYLGFMKGLHSLWSLQEVSACDCQEILDVIKAHPELEPYRKEVLEQGRAFLRGEKDKFCDYQRAAAKQEAYRNLHDPEFQTLALYKEGNR